MKTPEDNNLNPDLTPPSIEAQLLPETPISDNQSIDSSDTALEVQSAESSNIIERYYNLLVPGIIDDPIEVTEDYAKKILSHLTESFNRKKPTARTHLNFTCTTIDLNDKKYPVTYGKAIALINHLQELLQTSPLERETNIIPLPIKVSPEQGLDSKNENGVTGQLIEFPKVGTEVLLPAIENPKPNTTHLVSGSINKHGFNDIQGVDPNLLQMINKIAQLTRANSQIKKSMGAIEQNMGMIDQRVGEIGTSAEGALSLSKDNMNSLAAVLKENQFLRNHIQQQQEYFRQLAAMPSFQKLMEAYGAKILTTEDNLDQLRLAQESSNVIINKTIASSNQAIELLSRQVEDLKRSQSLLINVKPTPISITQITQIAALLVLIGVGATYIYSNLGGASEQSSSSHNGPEAGEKTEIPSLVNLKITNTGKSILVESEDLPNVKFTFEKFIADSDGNKKPLIKGHYGDEVVDYLLDGDYDSKSKNFTASYKRINQ